MDNTKKYVYGFLGIVILFLFGGMLPILAITVTGSGKVSVPANLARVSATVVETGDTVDLVEPTTKQGGTVTGYGKWWRK